MKATTHSLVMFGHRVRAHLLRLRFMLTHSTNFMVDLFEVACGLSCL